MPWRSGRGFEDGACAALTEGLVSLCIVCICVNCLNIYYINLIVFFVFVLFIFILIITSIKKFKYALLFIT